MVHHRLAVGPGEKSLVPLAGLESQHSAVESGEGVEGLELEHVVHADPLEGAQLSLGAAHEEARLTQREAQGLDGLFEFAG